MNIHFFVRTLDRDGGGVHHNAIAQVRALRTRGHEVTVHAFSSNNNPPLDIELVVHGKEALSFVAAHQALAESLHACGSTVDVFFLYGVDFMWGGGLYRMQGGAVPVAVYLDTYLATMGLGEVPFLYRLKRWVWDTVFGMRMAKHVDRFIAVSPFVEEQFVHSGFLKEKFCVVPNMFKFNEVSPRVAAQGPLQLLYAGRLIHDKGVDLLLEAVSGLTAYAWQLRIVGDGPLADTCRALVQKFKLVARVEILPWQSAEELQKEYERADLFVHPARWPEPFGRTVVEALAHAVPVVVPNRGGAAWIAGASGAVFRNGDVDDLRTVLESLLGSQEKRAALCAHAREQAERFSEERVVPQLEDALTMPHSLRAQ